MPTGIESAMPTTVETTVIQRLSEMPSTISSRRLAKSGGKKAVTNCAPRGRPSHTRFQLTSVVPKANARYNAAPKASVQRSQARLISGGFFQCRGAGTAMLMARTALGQSRQAVAIGVGELERHDVVILAV